MYAIVPSGSGKSVRKLWRDSYPWQWPLPAERRRDDKFGRWVERDLGSTGYQHVRVVPGLLTGQEWFLLGHPLPMIPDRPRPAGLPDARQAPALGFQLVGLYPHQYIDQVRDLEPPGPHTLDDKQRTPGRNPRWIPRGRAQPSPAGGS